MKIKEISIMSHQLFTELTLEQQEIVSGGGYDSSITKDLINTSFKQISQYLDFNVSSTPHGSSVTQKFAADQIKTAAKKLFVFEPVGGGYDVY
jgi:hypothetical protein